MPTCAPSARTSSASPNPRHAMLTISLTHLPHARKERFWDNGLRVVSRSGLNPTESTLLALLPTLEPRPRPLFLGGRTGALALAARLRGWGAGGLTLHTFDAHTESVLRRNLAENNAAVEDASVPNACAVSTTLDLAALDCDTVFWQLSKGDGTAERDLFVLEQLVCGPERAGRRLLIAAEAPNPTFVERFRKACAHVTLRREGAVTLLTGVVAKPIPADKLPNHRATFEVSLKGHAPIELVTWPGCFCHRRADMGGLALAEVVAEQVAFDPGDRVMDLGCGCGMVGLLLATAFPDKNLRVDYQDSNASARDSTLENLRLHPHRARFLFSADGLGDPNAYSLVLANPPYFGDWRIAEFFIQTAARLLKRGGLIAFVAKREAKPLEFLQANGLNPLGSFPRRGYTVLLAEKQ